MIPRRHIMLLEIILVCVGVSFDALALSICCGSVLGTLRYKQITKLALLFCAFQTGSGVLGALLSYIPIFRDDAGKGWQFGYVCSIIILIGIGLFLFYKGWKNEPVLERRSEIDFKKYAGTAAIASIDTLFAGASIAMWPAEWWSYAICLCLVTIAAVYLGVYIGYRLGFEPKNIAYRIGGAVLIVAAIDIFVRLFTD